MDGDKFHSGYFARPGQVADIIPFIILAGWAFAILIKRILSFKNAIFYIKLAFVCKSDASPAIMGRHSAVKRVYAALDYIFHIFKVADA